MYASHPGCYYVPFVKIVSYVSFNVNARVSAVLPFVVDRGDQREGDQINRRLAFRPSLVECQHNREACF